jgi:hypothetical protein
MLASGEGHLNIATMLVDRGADMNAPNMVSLRRGSKEGGRDARVF